MNYSYPPDEILFLFLYWRGLRFIQEVLGAIRAEVGIDYPVQLRVSASDFSDGGLTPAEVALALTFLEAELDAVHVSSGG
ncbi:hypothetical protein ACQKI4_30295, partial [Paenibacillus glucanolyticus]